MTKREAKRYVCRALALTVWGDIGQAGYINDHDSEEDCERLREAAHELYEELSRRGGELG